MWCASLAVVYALSDLTLAMGRTKLLAGRITFLLLCVCKNKQKVGDGSLRPEFDSFYHGMNMKTLLFVMVTLARSNIIRTGLRSPKSQSK